jgi:hypothetical protein
VTHKASLARDTRHTREYGYGVCVGGRCGHRTHTPDTPGRITVGIPLPMQYPKSDIGLQHELIIHVADLLTVGLGIGRCDYA